MTSTTNLSRIQGELAVLLSEHIVLDHYASSPDNPENFHLRCKCGFQVHASTDAAVLNKWTCHVASLWLPVYNERELRVLGAVHVDQEANNRNLNDFLADQRTHYNRMDKDILVEEMLRRDKNAVIQGRQLTDGRMAGRLLRELMRGMLQLADASELKQLESGLRANPKGMTVDSILGMLGAEPADRRLLAEAATTLGTGETPEERARAFEGLADGSLAHTRDTTTARPDVADSIRERRKRQVPERPDPGTVPGLGD